MNILSALRWLLPALVLVVQLVEGLFPNAKIGPFKLSIAVAVLKRITPLLSSGTVTLEALHAIMPDLVGDIVTGMNANPEMWKATPVVAPAA